ASPFQLNRVVDTPRRARASVGDGVYDVIAARRERGEVGQRPGRTGLRDTQRLALAAEPAYFLLDRIEKVSDVGLAVVDEPDHHTLSTGSTRTAERALCFEPALWIHHCAATLVHTSILLFPAARRGSPSSARARSKS